GGDGAGQRGGRGRWRGGNGQGGHGAAGRKAAKGDRDLAGRHGRSRLVAAHAAGRGRIDCMLRWLTAGESHGRALVAICEGMPAGVQVSTADIALALTRRRAGYGRGARMKFEQDEAEITGGVRHGRTLGSPVAITVANSEWPKWQTVMSPDEAAEEEAAD